MKAKTPPSPRFSRRTLQFLVKASRQKRPDWLDRNREEYERELQLPLQNLARALKTELGPLAPGYHFPQKGLGRLRRPAHAVAERGGGPFKDWMTYSAARPRTSRFEHNPNLFFLINPSDAKDKVLIAGGLYMPSSKQTRALREAIARDASAFDELFASKDFARRFPGGFSAEKISSRPTRGYDPAHPRMHWLRLQAFFVWRPYTLKEFTSPGFAALVASDCRQILRLNRLLEQALQGRLPASAKPAASSKRFRLADRLGELDAVAPKMDF